MANHTNNAGHTNKAGHANNSGQTISAGPIHPKTLYRYFVDHGQYLSFPSAPAYAHFPAGIYYPALENRDSRFVLMRIDPFSKRGTQDMLRDQSGQGEADSDQAECLDDEALLGELEAELNRIFSDENPPKNNIRTVSKKSLTRIEQSVFLDEGYFPMQDWNPGLAHVDKQIASFLRSRELYERNNLGYRRSVLLYGEPGTGKSRYIDQLSKRMIDENDAVVIRIDNNRELDIVIEKGLITLEAHLGDRMKVFIIEELAQIVNRSNITAILNFMDNAILRDNVLFLLTTNTPNRIPNALIDRPSRIDVIGKVSVNNNSGFIEAWYEHVTGKKLPVTARSQSWYNARLSPAYLKELFLLAMLSDGTLEEAWLELSRRRELIAGEFDERARHDFIL